MAWYFDCKLEGEVARDIFDEKQITHCRKVPIRKPDDEPFDEGLVEAGNSTVAERGF